jgi:ATP-dependent DNA helicase RecG
MAPTELLAEQHFRTLRKLLGPLGIRPVLLTGGNPVARRRAAELAAGPAQVVVGTHALFQESVRFRDLAVVIIDEQHRFGVTQRARLAGKGQAPNLFVMSATPIPRTLALTAYGDFDVSVLDELPPGRQPVVTVLAWGSDRRIAYETLAAHVAQGRQGYVVCPLVEGGDDSGLAAAEKEFSRLSRGVYASFRMGLVHGRTEAAEREETMRSFSAGKLQVLVATTVIEVGVDVPNATVMIVENAERFGLAQLHQLRGRVARGEQRGKCILLTRAGNPEVIARLRVLERTNDGFAIAEEDLRRRGPGEMAGTRQSGLPDLRMADLVADTLTLAMAREDAFGLDDAERRGLLRALKAAQKPEGWTL